MDSKRNNFVRFQSWSSEKSSSFEHKHSLNDRKYSRNSSGATFDRFCESFLRGFETIKCLKNNPPSIPSVDGQTRKDHSGPKTKTTILDPQDKFLQTWNKIFVLSCVISVALDPLFFYTPVLKVNEEKKCLHCSSDKTLAIIASVLRSVTDAFYAIHIYFQFRTGIIPPSSRVFGREDLIGDRMAIAKRYLSTYFIVDILAILPCPQVVVLWPGKRRVPWLTKEMLKYVIFSQYVPRLLRIYPLYVEVTRISGILAETAWAAAAYNLFLYMLASHVVGAFWYLFGMERQDACWQQMCRNITGCKRPMVYINCTDDVGPHHRHFHSVRQNFSEHFENISKFCLIVEQDDQKENSPNDTFDYGIFTKVLKSQVVAESSIRNKVSYCFWWGLRSLSSLGQNLDTSTYFWEIVFAVSIAIAGLVLFSLLIGNMQTYLQSTTVKVEEMRVRKTDAELWMSQRMLPNNLRERVRRFEQYKWLETRGVEEENLLRKLPKDLRRDIKRHLCLDLLKNVPMFETMDQQLWDPLIDRLKPVLYTQDSYIVREGDPVDEMLFIMRGNLATWTTNGGTTGFFNTADLKAGDFCGEELLTWALYVQSSTKFPISTRTVVAKAEVQAFALMADDLKTVASQFRKLHSKELQHTFKFYSQQWRTWAACFIQSAWRRYSRKKHEMALRDAERVLQLLPPKPSEPDFSVDQGH